jgi:hypothetical protein
MTRASDGKPQRPASDAQRRERLAAELRANLAKRKAQARARSASAECGNATDDKPQSS